MVDKTYRVGIAGATGAVGEEMIRLLVEREFPASEVRLFASARSKGRRLAFGGKQLLVEELTEEVFDGLDLCFFSCGGDSSRKYVPAAREAGTVVIDNSSAFRMADDVPLVIPEINGEAAEAHAGVLAVPNCTTIVFLMAAGPLHAEARLVRAVLSSYQAASGAGRAGLAEYDRQAAGAGGGGDPVAEVFPHVLHGNVIPHVDVFLDDGRTAEERKMEDETRKILGEPGLPVASTCVRVPVRRAHAVAAALEFERPLPAARARELLSAAPGVVVLDGADPPQYPTPLDVTGRLDTVVGRIREDRGRQNGLLLWAVGDQLLKGAAWNAVQIAEYLVQRGRL